MYRRNRAQSPPQASAAAASGDREVLGVYEADSDILDQYLHEVSMTPLLTSRRKSPSPGGSGPATPTRCRSW